MLKSLLKSALFCMVFSTCAFAIEVPFQLPNAFDPGQLQKNLKKEGISVQPTALPPVENKVEPHAPIRGGQSIKFKLNKVILVGNTVFTDTELQPIFSSSLHKTISIADLQSLVQEVSSYYRKAGYILSRAILPAQKIKNGVVKVEVIEGFIDKVTISGHPGGARKLIAEYGQLIAQSKPLKLAVIEREMLLLNELPGITVKAVLVPSKTISDAADLTLVADHKLLSASIEENNFGTRYIGPIQTSAAFSLNSIFVGGDTTGGNVTVPSKESEMQYYNLYHSEPLNSKGLSFTVGTSYTVTQPRFLLDALDVVGHSASFYGNLNYPLIRSREQNLSLHGNVNYQNVTSTILATPLYQDRVRSLGLGAVYDTTDRWNGSDSLGLDVIHGFPIMGAKMHAEQSRPEGRSDYTRVTAFLSRLQQPLFKWLSLYTSFSGQYSFQPLLATEQFSIGGPLFGRGYGPSEIVGDHGLAGKVELRYDTQPEKYFLQKVEYYVFYDAGVIWNRDKVNTPARQDLTSTGFGLRLGFTQHVYGDLYIAKPLSRKATTLTPTDQNPSQARGFFQIIAML